MTTLQNPPAVPVQVPNGKRKGDGRRPVTLARVILHVALSIGLVITLLPFIWMVLGAFKTNAEIMRRPITWWPQAPTLDNFTAWFFEFDMSQYFFNSVFLAVVSVASTLIFCSMVGWALAKLDFPGKRALIAVVLGTLFVPGIVTLIPTFVLVANMGLVGTYWGMILPGMVGAFGVFLMRQFMLQIPDELLDAARIDGAGEFRIFAQIVLPLCKAPLATLAIFTFMGSWNGFLWPLIVAQDESLYTLPVALALYTSPTGDRGAEYGLQMAGAVLIILPVLAIFIAMQKHFVQGIAMTGIK